MKAGPRLPCALTVAGSDSGGGAGIQADLKTFAALGVHGTSAITCLTAQNPRGVLGIQATEPKLVRLQINAVMDALHPVAVKTGMLYSREIIEAAAEELGARRPRHLIIDPVMIATSGARLLKQDAIIALQEKLIRIGTLVTPNVDETLVLSEVRIQEPEDLRRAARVIRERFGCAALIKGGHLAGPEALDVFWDGREELLLRAPRIRGVSSHGTGCTYSAAITGYLALGMGLPEAVVRAKDYVTRSIQKSRKVGKYAVLEHFVGRQIRPPPP